MTIGKRRFLFILIGVIVILGAAAYLRIRQTALEEARAPRPVPVVETGTPLRQHLTNALSFTGDVLPIRQANIYSRVTGNIEHMYVDLGSPVRAGQPIALIDTTLYAQTARQTYAQWHQALASLDNAKTILTRTKNLFEKNLVAQQDLDNAETSFKTAQAQTEAAEAAYRNAATTLTYCTIRAPFAGFITKRFLDPGAYVNNIPTAAGSSLYTLMEADTLKVLVNVLERDIMHIPDVRTALVKVDAFPDTSFTATVRRTGEAVDLATRTFPVEVDIRNASHIIKPGMFATVRLVLEEIDSALTVPSDAVITIDSASIVYTVSPDSVVHHVDVTTGIGTTNRVQINSGLSDNARIVVQGQQLLRDGMKVRIVR